VNGEPVRAPLERGYLSVEREWRAGDQVELELAMPVQRVRGHQRIAATSGKVAFERGPIVHCVEQIDANDPLEALSVPAAANVTPVPRADLLGGLTLLHVAQEGRSAFDAVPYFAWNNRGLAPMAVWLPAT
jgi:DUF1680 family protein